MIILWIFLGIIGALILTALAFFAVIGFQAVQCLSDEEKPKS